MSRNGERKTPSRSGTWLLLLPLIAAPMILLSRQLLGGQALFWGTPGLQFIPWRMMAWESLQQGILPLWNSLNGMGAPLAANYQVALFYPPGWLIYLFAASGGVEALAWSHTLLAAAHLAFAGIGMARLARSLGLGLLAQTIVGLTFSLGGYWVARLGFFSMIWTGAWMPWVLLAARQLATIGSQAVNTENQKLLSKTSGSNLIGLGVALGMMLLAGHAQLSWYILLYTGAWVGWIILTTGLSGQAWKTLARFGLAAGLAFALSAVQLIPTAEYLLQSQRSAAVDWETMLTYSFWPWRLLTLFAPDMFGNPGQGDYWGYASHWEDTLYIGLLPLLLALGTIKIAISSRKRKIAQSQYRPLVIFLWIMIGAGFLLALGKNTPVFPLLAEHVPTFGMFNAPARFLIWAAFGLPLLAGIGVESWRTPGGRGLYWLRLATAGAFAVTLGSFLGWFFLGDVRPTFVRAMALAGMWGLGAGLATLFKPEESQQRRFAAWKWLVIAWITCDLLVMGWDLNPSVPAAFYTRPNLNKLAERMVGQRLYLGVKDEYRLKFDRFLRFGDYRPIENWSNLRTAELPNLNILDSLPTANNFDPLLPGRYAEWMRRLDEMDPGHRSGWLRLMNVGLMEAIDVQDATGIRYTPLEGGRRLGWYACMTPAASGGEAYQKLQAQLNADAVLERVVIEGMQDIGCHPTAELAEIHIVNEYSGYVQIRATTPAEGWLALSETWYPGWQASIDGIPVSNYRTNYLFQGVRLPAGEHEIIFRYTGAIFLPGAGLAAAAWIIVLTWVIIYKINQEKISGILNNAAQLKKKTNTGE